MAEKKYNKTAFINYLSELVDKKNSSVSIHHHENGERIECRWVRNPRTGRRELICKSPEDWNE